MSPSNGENETNVARPGKKMLQMAVLASLKLQKLAELVDSCPKDEKIPLFVCSAKQLMNHTQEIVIVARSFNMWDEGQALKRGVGQFLRVCRAKIRQLQQQRKAANRLSGLKRQGSSSVVLPVNDAITSQSPSSMIESIELSIKKMAIHLSRLLNEREIERLLQEETKRKAAAEEEQRQQELEKQRNEAEREQKQERRKLREMEVEGADETNLADTERAQDELQQTLGDDLDVAVTNSLIAQDLATVAETDVSNDTSSLDFSNVKGLKQAAPSKSDSALAFFEDDVPEDVRAEVVEIDDEIAALEAELAALEAEKSAENSPSTLDRCSPVCETEGEDTATVDSSISSRLSREGKSSKRHAKNNSRDEGEKKKKRKKRTDAEKQERRRTRNLRKAEQASLNAEIANAEKGPEAPDTAAEQLGEVIDENDPEVKRANRKKMEHARAMDEILDSERVYFQNLRYMNWGLVAPMTEHAKSSSKPVVSEKEVSTIFSNVEALIQFNKALLKELEAVKEVPPDERMIGDIFIKLSPLMRLYTDYVNKYDNAIKCVISCSERPEFLALVDKCLSDCPGTLALNAYLIMPVQRLPRYEMLLRALLKLTKEDHPDREPLSRALEFVTEINGIVNSKKRHAERQEDMMKICEQIVGSSKPLVQPHRLFVREGALEWCSGTKVSKKRERAYFFLFNDALVRTRKNKKKNVCEFKELHNLGQLYLRDVKYNPFTMSEKDKFMFKLVRQENEKEGFTFVCTSEVEKTEWVASVEEAIRLRDELEDFQFQ